VRSYFYGDERKQIANLLAEVRSVDGIECEGELEALVVEARLIRRHEPKYNRRGKTWRRGAYLKLDLSEAWPRLKVVHAAKHDDRCVYLGPFGNTARARLAKEALEHTVPIRRCTTSMGVHTRFAPCALADMGRCAAPCDGRTDQEHYGELIRWLVSSLGTRPSELLEALERRMASLAQAERYEEAASARDRLHALAEALWRSRVDAWLVGAGRLNVAAERGPVRGAVQTFDHGTLAIARLEVVDDALTLPCPRERADELAAVRSWIVKHRPRVLSCDRAPAEPIEGGAALARVLRGMRRASHPAGSAGGRGERVHGRG
jgi:DNA polymerase-3 subunit epsilon